MSADPVAVVERLIGAFNRRDRDAVAGLLAADVSVIGIPLPEAKGRDAAMALLDPFLAADEIHWRVLAIAANGQTVFTERLDRFRFDGRDWGSVRAAGVFEVNAEGRIAAWRDYFDMGELQRAMS